MRNFAKFATGFWTSPAIEGLSDQGKLLAAYLISGPHSNNPGLYRIPNGYIQEDLGWTAAKIEGAFVELSARRFATRCPVTKWVVLHKGIKHYQPKTMKEQAHVVGIVRLLPPEATIRELVAEVLSEHWQEVPSELVDWLLGGPNPVRTPSEPGPNVRHEVDVDVDVEKDEEGEARKARAAAASPGPPPRRRVRHTDTSIPADFTISEAVKTWAVKRGWAPYLQAHYDWFVDYSKARPDKVRYTDWDAAFRNCITSDWGEVREKLLKNGHRAPHHFDTSCKEDVAGQPCGNPGAMRDGGVYRCDHHERIHLEKIRTPMSAETRARLDELLGKTVKRVQQ